jgi:SAM-dependent methyltransferase
MFATSQDHIQDIDAAMAEVRRVVRPDGRFYMWIGLYDPEMLAWSKSFHNLAYNGGPLKRTARFALVNAEYSYLVARMFDRRRRLKKGLRIDNCHERWYTKELVRNALVDWGLAADRWMVVPGTTSLFVDARASRTPAQVDLGDRELARPGIAIQSPTRSAVRGSSSRMDPPPRR